MKYKLTTNADTEQVAPPDAYTLLAVLASPLLEVKKLKNTKNGTLFIR